MHPSEASLRDLNVCIDFIKGNIPELCAIGEIGLDYWYKWVKKDGGDLVPIKQVDEVQDDVQLALKKLQDGNFATDAVDDKVSVV